MKTLLTKLKRILFPEKKGDSLICSEIFESLSILADGSVTCGCVDIYEDRILGNVNREQLRNIFDNERYKLLRKSMLDGNLPPQCINCPLRVRRRTGNEKIEACTITWLQIDPIFNCNLKCPDCAFTEMRENNYFIRPRTAISLETFKNTIDQVTPTLKHIRFHMLGEPFLNKKAMDMIAYAKKKIPDVFISIETNGILVEPDIQKSLVKQRVDYVKFSIDGASQESYEKYRVGGDFQKAYENMAGLVRERNSQAADRPRVVWQYILFKWNDSDEEIKKAQKLAEKAEVDELYWLLTHSRGASDRFLPGKQYPIFLHKGQSLNVTIDLAATKRIPMIRPPLTPHGYDPWK